MDDAPQALAVSGLAPELLMAEIIETALISDIEEMVRLVKAFEALGIGLATDGFGGGYSSFAQLRSCRSMSSRSTRPPWTASPCRTRSGPWQRPSGG